MTKNSDIESGQVWMHIKSGNSYRIVDLEGGIMTHSDNLPEEQKVFTCGFCGKAHKEVQVMIVGPTPDLTIGSECVRLCVSVLFDKAEGKTIQGEEPR